MDLHEIIGFKISQFGITQNKIAEELGIYQNRVTSFLQGKCSLQNINDMIKLAGDVNESIVDLILLAKKTASKLKNVSLEEVRSLETFGLEEEKYLLKMSVLDILKSNLASVEYSFQYFKALVLYYMVLGNRKPTSGTASEVFHTLAEFVGKGKVEVMDWMSMYKDSMITLLAIHLIEKNPSIAGKLNTLFGRLATIAMYL